jgi:hypothetical protein
MTKTVNKKPPTGEGLTFEKVWAGIQESREQFKEEMAESRKEFDRRQQEADRRRQEEDRRRQ